MSTYLELQQRVANDYLNRTDYGSEVKRSLLQAIRHYERRRWRFNETSTALTTSAGQTFLTLPSNFLVLDYLQVTQSGSRWELEPRDLDQILSWRASSATGVPTDFTIYQNRIELFAIPDSAYSCPCYYIKTLSELSADADSNSWTTGAIQDVIVHHAAKLMWANVIRNDKEAIKHNQLEQAALMNITGELEQFKIRSLKPTQF